MESSEANFPAILTQARAGSGDAWAQIYRSYAPKVFGYLRARNAADPDDLAGEVFLQVVRDLHRFDGDERAFRAWLFTVAHHRLLDDARLRSRRPEVLTAEPISAEPVGDVEAEAMNLLAEQRLLGIIQGLSDDQQAVMLLRLFGDLTVPQVATILGKTPGAVKAAQHRAFDRLRGILTTERTVPEPGLAMQENPS